LPTVPANPAATAQAADQVTVSWTASSDERGVTSYLVYRGGSLVGLVSGFVTSFTDRTTAPVTAYSYTVAALDGAGNASAQSSAAGVTTPASGPTVVAADRFGRTVSGGWGNADAGGAWSGTDSTFSVDGSTGVVALTKGATKNAYLASASGANTELLVRVRVDHIASGTATTDGFYLRRQDSNNYYRVAAVFNTNSSIGLSFVRDAAGTTTTIGTASVSGITHSTSSWYWVRARLSGTTATTAQIRLWADGTSEPTGWTLASTDSSTPSNLRGSGSTGIYFDAKKAVNAYYDDLTLRPIDSTAPSTPTGLSGTPVAAGRIDLAWTASSDNVAVAGYNVYRDGAKINTAPIGSTSYSDTGLLAGVNHTYAISALDAAGNESSRSGTYSGAAGTGVLTTTYTYDAENRLTQLASDSTVIGTYAYDGAGNRYAKTAGGVTTAYTLDLASSLPGVLTETAGSSVTSYAYAGGPLEIDRSGATYWYLSDTLGSVRLVTDSTGASPATYAYTAFGSTRASTGTVANEVRFTGERTDGESGLEFLRARTYDPSTGTFLQRDSWGITPTSSQSIDGYAYTANNPVNAVDPSGHQTRVYDEGPVDHGILVASTSAYTAPIKAMSAAQRGDVLSGASETATLRKAMKKANPAPQGRPDCGGNPACAINNAVGTAGDIVSPVMPIAVVGGSAAICFLGPGEVTLGAACLPFVGVSIYTAANAADNLSKGNLSVFDRWNWQDAATGGIATTLITVVPEATGSAMLAGFGLGFVGDLVDQQMQKPGQPNWNHALCSGAGGGYAAGAVFSGDWIAKEVKGAAWDFLTTIGATKFCGGQ
jgi:RHS repeat-associated protein